MARAAARLLQLLWSRVPRRTQLARRGGSLPPVRLDDAPRFSMARGAALRRVSTFGGAKGCVCWSSSTSGSFNVLVLEAPPSDDRAALARAMGPAAAARGLDLLLDPPAESGAPALPFVSPAVDPSAGAPSRSC